MNKEAPTSDRVGASLFMDFLTAVTAFPRLNQARPDHYSAMQKFLFKKSINHIRQKISKASFSVV